MRWLRWVCVVGTIIGRRNPPPVGTAALMASIGAALAEDWRHLKLLQVIELKRV